MPRVPPRQSTMKRVSLLVVVGVLLTLVVPRKVSGQTPCSSAGWFGDNCKYQCHCEGGADCSPHGDCPARCEGQWFGPQCQYLDVAYSTMSIFTDGNDATCMTLSTSDSDRPFQLSVEVWFTWMRIVTLTDGLLDHITITFKTGDGTTLEPTTPLTIVYLSNSMVDLYGELPQRIKQIQLRWKSSGAEGSICSLFVSGGRNVALKQDTRQSSTYQNGYSDLAVDGGTSRLFSDYSCTHTDSGITNWWTVFIYPPVSLDRYKIYNRADGLTCRLWYFHLESFNEDHKVQEHKDKQISSPVNIYDVYAQALSPVTSVNISVSLSYFPSGEQSCVQSGMSTILTLCEVEIFGDSVCTDASWGRQCENSCGKCESGSACLVSTGSCPTGCAKGFYGSGCTKTCPPNCKDNVCNALDGKCTNCPAGYTGDLCETDCPRTYFGISCRRRCSDTCVGQLCDPVTGVCNNCQPGKQPGELSCHQNCSFGYYGHGCTIPCKQCGGTGACDPITGACGHCKAGYRGNRCDQPCQHAFYGEGCAQLCSQCVVDTAREPSVCHHQSGHCFLGVKDDSSDTDSVFIAVITVLAVLLGLSIAVIILFYRKWKPADGKTKQQALKMDTTEIAAQRNHNPPCDRNDAQEDRIKTTMAEMCSRETPRSPAHADGYTYIELDPHRDAPEGNDQTYVNQ